MVSSLLAGINALLVDRGGLMPESLTRKNAVTTARMAGFKSERWPASNRNPGRFHVGTPGRIKSESAVGGLLSLDALP
jgi:hypothetical protein